MQAPLPPPRGQAAAAASPEAGGPAACCPCALAVRRAARAGRETRPRSPAPGEGGQGGWWGSRYSPRPPAPTTSPRAPSPARRCYNPLPPLVAAPCRLNGQQDASAGEAGGTGRERRGVRAGPGPRARWAREGAAVGCSLWPSRRDSAWGKKGGLGRSRLRPPPPPPLPPDDINTMSFTTLLSAQIAEW